MACLLHLQGLGFASFEAYVESYEFYERRLCPCYVQMPRALSENMNCIPIPATCSVALSDASLSDLYLACQAVNSSGIYDNRPITAVSVSCRSRRGIVSGVKGTGTALDCSDCS